MAAKYKDVFVIQEGDGKDQGKTFWTKVGVAFENKDGSYSITLAAVPVHGRLHMRDPSPRKED